MNQLEIIKIFQVKTLGYNHVFFYQANRNVHVREHLIILFVIQYSGSRHKKFNIIAYYERRLTVLSQVRRKYVGYWSYLPLRSTMRIKEIFATLVLLHDYYSGNAFIRFIT